MPEFKVDGLNVTVTLKDPAGSKAFIAELISLVESHGAENDRGSYAEAHGSEKGQESINEDFEFDIRKRSMKKVDEVLDVLLAKALGPKQSFEKYHQILDTAKEMLTLLSMNGHSRIKSPE